MRFLPSAGRGVDDVGCDDARRLLFGVLVLSELVAVAPIPSKIP